MRIKQLTISDSSMYIGARYLSFFIASIASAMFNIFLFTALDPSWAYLLIALSIALEGAKLTTVISINVVRSLFMKLNYKPLLRKSKWLFFWYLIYGFLSILASLGFSTYITARTQAIRNSDLEILASRQYAIEMKMNEIVSLQQSASIPNYMEYPLWIDANLEYQDYNRRYEEADLLDSQLRLERDQVLDRDSEEWREADRRYQAQRTFLNNVRAQRQRADGERQRIQASFEQSKNDMDGQLNLLNNQLQTIIVQAGIEALDGSTALIIIKEQIQNEEIKLIREKGMTYMFEGFSDYTKGAVSPEFIKIFILLLASLLLELTIFQCAPSVRISGSILKYFKRNLPEDKTFQEILEMYNDENEAGVNTIMSGPVRKVKKSKVKFPSLPKTTEADIERLLPAKEAKVLTPEEWKEWEKDANKMTTEELVSRLKADNQTEEEVREQLKDEGITVQVEEPEVPKRIPSEEKKTIRYRFGRTTNLIANKLCDFIRLCINEPGQFIMSPEDAAEQLKLNRRAKEVFLDHLSNLKLGSKQLIFKKGDDYYTNFSADEIISYATEIIEE